MNASWQAELWGQSAPFTLDELDPAGRLPERPLRRRTESAPRWGVRARSAESAAGGPTASPAGA